MRNRTRTGEFMNGSLRAVEAFGNFLDHEVEAEARADAAVSAIVGLRVVTGYRLHATSVRRPSAGVSFSRLPQNGTPGQDGVDVKAFDPLLCPLRRCH